MRMDRVRVVFSIVTFCLVKTNQLEKNMDMIS